jgi:hypothetical protein
MVHLARRPDPPGRRRPDQLSRPYWKSTLQIGPYPVGVAFTPVGTLNFLIVISCASGQSQLLWLFLLCQRSVRQIELTVSHNMAACHFGSSGW